MKQLCHCVPITRACELLGISRSWYYGRSSGCSEADIALQDEIERIVLAWPGYGYRRVAYALEQLGIVANHKRVLRIMREQSWLCRVHRAWRRTTQSDHGLPVYPNLLAEMTVTALNQVWVADITYIRLKHEFVYLAVILDAYSRRVIGWNLSRRIDTQLTLVALETALACRTIGPGTIHHSDRGVQYAAKDYVALAQQAGLTLSMSRRGCPTDNPQAESFFSTLKREQVYLTEYYDFDDAYSQLSTFIEQVYNTQRLHSRIGYCSPAQFEQKLTSKQKGHPGQSTVGALSPELPMAPAPTV